MKAIANILSGITQEPTRTRTLERQSSRVSSLHGTKTTNGMMSNDPEAAPYNPPAPVPCEYCGAPRYTEGIDFGSRVIWMPSGPQQCTCPEAVAAYEKKRAEAEAAEAARQKAEEDRKMRERVQRIIGESGMGFRFLRRTFATFEITSDNKRPHKAAKNYVDTFSSMLPSRENLEPGRNGLFITGPKGTGKTHLAAAIANQLMQQGTAVICMTMIDLLERIKRTYERSKDSESTVLNLYKQVPLLIIDDIGKEPATEWGISKIYAIINGRYEGYMPTIVTTNYDDQQLVKRLTPANGDDITAEATIDRLREMCLSIQMAGDSWRSR
jgi:DNA replication protein DnaC